MDVLANLFRGGVNGLIEYLSAHVITCLVPALFIAGAIATFVSQAAILKYFGPQAKKPVSYSVASVSGACLLCVPVLYYLCSPAFIREELV